tara:strand:+ start:894 stop:1295 length:402 start_codon:yes stop_codon:yes gene_type:complete
MKKTLLLAAALACSGAVAQEKQVWACQQTEGTMLNWEGGAWRQRTINPSPILLTIDGENSSYKEGDYETRLDCSEKDISGAYVTSCLDNLLSEHIYLETATGKMGISNLYGAISSSSVSRDSVSARIYNCTKF